MIPATVVLVSPPCATPAAWSRVIPLLEDRGVPKIAVQLPSCLPESDLDDAAFFHHAVDLGDDGSAPEETRRGICSPKWAVIRR